MIWQTSSTNSADTERLGELLGEQLRGGEVIELHSDLGGGKTTLARGLVHGAGSLDRVSSPTFTLSRVYKTKNYDIYHFDFYRLSEPGILADQLAEAVQNNNIVIIEWAGIVEEVLPDERISIELEPVASSPDERQITVTYNQDFRKQITAVQAAWQDVEP